MVRIDITESLYAEIEKTFKKQAIKIFDFLETLNESPRKGKVLGTVGGIVIKELRFEGWRFYFITDGYALRCFNKEELEELLIRFVRMSNKKEQQKVIEEIRNVLLEMGPEGL